MAQEMSEALLRQGVALISDMDGKAKTQLNFNFAIADVREMLGRGKGSADKPAGVECDDQSTEGARQQALAACTRVRQLRRDLQQVKDELIEREADLPSTFVKYIRESINVLRKWRDSHKPSRNVRREFTKRA